MTVIATASNPRFSVSRVDIDRGGPTYTIDTLTDLRRQRPDAELFFITGADALAQIVSWRDNQQLFDLAHFIGVTRPGFLLADSHLPEGVVSLVEVPAMAISSTDCRERVGRGMPVWYLVPDGVVQYIEKRGLYREGPRRGAADGVRNGQGHAVPLPGPLAGDQPTYDRPPPPSSPAGPGDSDLPPPNAQPPNPQPPNPHLQEVPR
jgi:nicotinate-nucleotide adenylyltransferase